MCEVQNSSGYFKDPITKEDLTGLESRVIECSITDEGKLIWPQIKFSDGTTGKIVYRLWTAEEKKIYKEYRALGKQRPKKEKQTVVKRVKVKEEVTHSQVTDDKIIIEREIDYNGSIASAGTMKQIKESNYYLGSMLFDNIVFDKLSKNGATGTIYCIPRNIIPKEDRIRLGISEVYREEV